MKNALERHRCLVKKLLQGLMKERNVSNKFSSVQLCTYVHDFLNKIAYFSQNCLCNWKGNFSPEAELILKQHLIQSNLTNQDDLIAKWTGYVDVIRNNPVNFVVFDNLLDELLQSNEENMLTKVKVS